MDKKCEKKEEDEKCHSGLGLAILVVGVAIGLSMLISGEIAEPLVILSMD